MDASVSFIDQAPNPKHMLPARSFPALSCAKSPRSRRQTPETSQTAGAQQSFALCDPALAGTRLRPPPIASSLNHAEAPGHAPLPPPPGILADPKLPHVAPQGTARPCLLGTGRSKPSSDRPGDDQTLSSSGSSSHLSPVEGRCRAPAKRGAGSRF